MDKQAFIGNDAISGGVNMAAALAALMNGGQMRLIKAWPPAFSDIDWGPPVECDFTGYARVNPTSFGTFENNVVFTAQTDFVCSGGTPQTVVGWTVKSAGDVNEYIVRFTQPLRMSAGKTMRFGLNTSAAVFQHFTGKLLGAATPVVF
jgi:hypothetical protein